MEDVNQHFLKSLPKILFVPDFSLSLDDSAITYDIFGFVQFQPNLFFSKRDSRYQIFNLVEVKV